MLINAFCNAGATILGIVCSHFCGIILCIYMYSEKMWDNLNVKQLARRDLHSGYIG